jgi:hypothetical protein
LAGSIPVRRVRWTVPVIHPSSTAEQWMIRSPSWKLTSSPSAAV